MHTIILYVTKNSAKRYMKWATDLWHKSAAKLRFCSEKGVSGYKVARRLLNIKNVNLSLWNSFCSYLLAMKALYV